MRRRAMSNLVESHKFLSTYAWREGYLPAEVDNVLEILNAMINQEIEGYDE
jgi:hypothetical protein